MGILHKSATSVIALVQILKVLRLLPVQGEILHEELTETLEKPTRGVIVKSIKTDIVRVCQCNRL